MVSAINTGTLFAFFLIRKADLWGRKRVMTITIIGYTLFTGCSAFAQNVYMFTAFQLLARIFLIAEWGVAMIYAAEEFPASKRGMTIGLIQGFSSLGAICCAAVTPLFLSSAMGWRSLYLFGMIPLIIMAYLRRDIQESARFEQVSAPKQISLLHLLTSPYRNRLLLMGLLWSLSYLGFSNAVTFWKSFALEQRGWTDSEVGIALTIASMGSMPLIFFSGALLDKIGRKWGGAVIYLLGCAGVSGAFLLHDSTHLQIALTFAIFGVSAFLPVLNSFGTELFPTNIRSEAFGWANNIIGRIGYILAPLLIAAATQISIHGRTLTMGESMSLATIAPLIALVIMLFSFPETKNQDLEQTAILVSKRAKP